MNKRISKQFIKMAGAWLLVMLLILTGAAAEEPDIEILGLMETVAMGMDGTAVSEQVTAVHEGASVYSDGTMFKTTVLGYEETNVLYLWPKDGQMNQVVYNFSYDENGPTFNEILAMLQNSFGEPALRMDQDNLFKPTSSYEWSIAVSNKVSTTKQTNGSVENQTVEAVEYLVEYGDSTLLILIKNTEMKIFVELFGSLRNIGTDDYVELIYTVLSDADAQAVREAGLPFATYTTEAETAAAEAETEAAEAPASLTDGEFTYTITGGAAMVTGYTGSGKTVKIPAEVNGYPVTVVEGFGKGYSELNSIILPESISSFQAAAFSAFANVSFTVEGANEHLASINGSLYNKKEKTLLFGAAGVLEIPEGIVAIAPDACRARKFTTVKLPGSLKAIGARAFENADLSFISFGEGLEEIGENAFCNASLSRSALKLPESLITIGDRAFKNFGVVSEISLGSRIAWIGDEAFAGLNILGTHLAHYPCSHSKCRDDHSMKFYLTLPSTLTHLGTRAFADLCWVHKDGSGGYCSVSGKFSPADGKFRYVYYPGTLNITFDADALGGVIPDGAFDQQNGRYEGWNNHNISDPQFYVKVTLSGNGTTLKVGNRAFRNLNNITLPTGTKIASVGSNAFEETNISGTLSFTDECTVFPSGAFHDASGMFLITYIPDSVTRIESQALSFSGITEIELGPQLEFIAPDAFRANVLFTIYSDTYAEQWAIDNLQNYQYTSVQEDDLSWLNN